ncbi:MAG: P-type conjugative transfer protein TrbL [Acidithiobacillus sp.]
MHALKARFRLLLLLLVLPVTAQASPTTHVGLSTIINVFRTTTQGWYSAIFTDALGLFGALFGIEITWLAVTWMIGGKDVHDIFSSFVKKLLTIGFFYTVLESSSQWVPWILGGFKNVAITAGGEPVTTVGFIAMTGLRAFVLCIEAGPMAMAHDASGIWTNAWNLNLGGVVSSFEKFASADLGTTTGIGLLVGAIVGLILILSFTYVVLELVAVQLEGMIVLSVGVIMLGFGGSSFTARFVESYMQYAVAVGVRLMVITLWASFIEWQVNPLIKTTLVNGNASMTSYGIVLILALLIAWLTKKLPGFANSILSGQSTLSGGELYDAVKKGTIAAAAVVTGGAALAAGAAGAAGAGAMGASQGAAGSAGAGSMGASQAGGAAASSEAGGMQASSAVPAPAPQSGPKTQSSAVPAPSADQASSGAQAESSGSQVPAPASTGQAPSGGQTPVASGQNTASAGGQAPTSTGQAPSSAGQTPSDPVDHRATAPNSAPSGGQAPSSGVPAPASTGSGASAGGKAPPSIFEQTQKALHGAHDLVSPGKPSSGGVSAPSLGVKHLSD